MEMHSAAMLTKELVTASTVPLVLSVLTEGESYGYALIQPCANSPAAKSTVGRRNNYPVLHRMEQEDLMRSRMARGGDRTQTQILPTPQGRQEGLQQEQQQWLAVHETLTKLWKYRVT